MKKDKTMKKNSFVKGALITTIGIVIAKILGILYVIPFHAIIGEKGGALYGYAYTIYLIFMSISSAGIPLAISKVISEYQTLGYSDAKKRAFYLGKKISLIMGMLCFIILIIFAPFIAQWVLGDLTGGNTLEDVTFVIRVIASAILIVPVLSVYRGYYEGHRIMSPPSISQVIEQIVRVLVIVLGSYLVLDIFNLDLKTAVGVAVFGATVGALVSYLYLAIKMLKNKAKFKVINKANEPKISDKVIFKKIVIYAVPFIMIDIFKSLYSYVDMVTVVKGLVNYAAYSVSDAESIMSMLSTWGAKFNMIVLSISTGVVVSLIPNLTKSMVDKDDKAINKRINQAMGVMLYLMVPMTIGISFLAGSIWNVFYGASVNGPILLKYYIFVGLLGGIFTALITVVQVLKDYKTVFIALFSGLAVKIFLNLILINNFYKLGFPPYYGVITSTLIAYLVSIVICIVVLIKKFNINFEESVKNLIDVLVATVLMLLILYVFTLLIPIYNSSRIDSLISIIIYGVIGSVMYFLFTYKTPLFKNVFGNKLDNYLKKNTK